MQQPAPQTVLTDMERPRNFADAGTIGQREHCPRPLSLLWRRVSQRRQEFSTHGRIELRHRFEPMRPVLAGIPARLQ